MTTMKIRFGGVGGALPGLPPPAPLPGLGGAFSRRRAIFGAVAVAAVPAAILGASAADIGRPMMDFAPGDTRLLELADAYEALDRQVNATLSTDPGYEALVDQYSPLETELVETPAASMVGVMAKVRLCGLSTIRDCVTDLPLSIADDLVRLQGEGRLA